MSARDRLTSLIEGVLAANIFDWGARATVELYQNGTILEIYRSVQPRFCLHLLHVMQIMHFYPSHVYLQAESFLT